MEITDCLFQINMEVRTVYIDNDLPVLLQAAVDEIADTCDSNL